MTNKSKSLIIGDNNNPVIATANAINAPDHGSVGTHDPDQELKAALTAIGKLFVEKSAQAVIYAFSGGLLFKQAQARFKRLHKKDGKAYNAALVAFVAGMPVSLRTLQRWNQVVQKLQDEGKLTGVLSDALRAGNFSSDVQKQVIEKVSEGKDLSALYIEYGITKNPDDETENTKAPDLKNELKRLIKNFKELMKKGKASGVITTNLDAEAFMKGFTEKLNDFFNFPQSEPDEKPSTIA